MCGSPKPLDYVSPHLTQVDRTDLPRRATEALRRPPGRDVARRSVHHLPTGCCPTCLEACKDLNLRLFGIGSPRACRHHAQHHWRQTLLCAPRLVWVVPGSLLDYWARPVLSPANLQDHHSEEFCRPLALVSASWCYVICLGVLQCSLSSMGSRALLPRTGVRLVP